MQRIGGNRRKTRHLYTKPNRQKGKLNIKRYMQEFNEGEKVKLLFDSSVDISVFSKRYFGKVGVVKGKRGECYEIDVKSPRGINKTLIVHPAHLTRQ